MFWLFVASCASALVQFVSQLPWTVLFLCTNQIKLYYLTDKTECARIQKRIKVSSHVTDGHKSYGYSIGQWYFLHLAFDARSETYSIYMIATPESHHMLTHDPCDTFQESTEQEHQSSSKCLNIYERTGSFANPWFRKRTRKARDIPFPEQTLILDDIVSFYSKHKTAVVLLHGPPGTGKSMLGVLLATHFSGSFCNTLRPWQPGDTLGSVYSEVEPTETRPLVLVFDEIDAAFDKIASGIKPHDLMPIPVRDKEGWNHMLDEIQRFMFPYLIVVLTTNVKPEHICDQSFIRPGRVNLKFEMIHAITK
jgi:hypothetical protein